MSEQRRELQIIADHAIAQGEPVVNLGAGVRVVDLIDRLDAPDRPERVAQDFGLETPDLLLLMELRHLMGKTVEGEREEWRGKAEHRLHEWRLRVDDALAAEADKDEADAAKDMWRDRALKAEAVLEKVIR